MHIRYIFNDFIYKLRVGFYKFSSLLMMDKVNRFRIELFDRGLKHGYSF